MESIFAPRETVSRSDNTQIIKYLARASRGANPKMTGRIRGSPPRCAIREKWARVLGGVDAKRRTATPPTGFAASGGARQIHCRAETYRSESKVVRYQQQHDVTDWCRGRRARVPRRTHHRRGRMHTNCAPPRPLLALPTC
jgi:hypothetical protein